MSADAMKEAIRAGFMPDWCEICTAEQAEKNLKGFQFKGVGWYLTKSDTMLVVPMHKKLVLFKDEVADTYAFHVWNRTGVGDAFNWIVNAPVRKDER